MGTVYGGRWKRMGSIGEGGQACTFRVRDLHNGSTNWVLKELKNRERLGRFEREIRALDALYSPHIPRTVDYSIKKPAYHVTADLGLGLDKYATSHNLVVDHALHLFEQVASAVRDAHEGAGVVHRDIKPNNVVISRDGAKAHLIDFGICQYSDGEPTLLTTEEAFGNPAFAAPECSLGREEEPGLPCDVYSLGKLLYWMVSGGNHIQRENLAPTVLGRIATDNDLIRFYLARLLRGTIVEQPGQRWTASRFLEEVRTTRKLLDRVKEYEDRGLIVLTDGFGAGDSFGETSIALATAKDPNYPSGRQVIHLGDPPDDQDVGAAFKVLADRDVRLETIALGLAHMAGEDELDIWVVTDLNGKPDVDGELEVFRVSGDGSYSSRVEQIRSQERPVLRRGHRYWILLSVPVPHSAIALWSAPLDFVPRPALYAERLNGGEWDVHKSPSGPGHAIRVTGRPVEQR